MALALEFNIRTNGIRLSVKLWKSYYCYAYRKIRGNDCNVSSFIIILLLKSETHDSRSEFIHIYICFIFSKNKKGFLKRKNRHNTILHAMGNFWDFFLYYLKSRMLLCIKVYVLRFFFFFFREFSVSIKEKE